MSRAFCGSVAGTNGWLLAGTGVRQWDVGDVGSGDESNLALVGKASAQDAQYAACARQVAHVKPKPP